MLLTKACYCSRLYFRCVKTLSLSAIIYNKQANPGITWHLAKIRGGGDYPPALPVSPALQKSNEIGEYGRVKTLSSSTIIYNKQAKPWSRRRPAADGTAAAGCGGGSLRGLASGRGHRIVRPRGGRVGGKRRKKKRGANRRRSLPSEPWMALLLLFYYTWIVVWFSKIVEF